MDDPTVESVQKPVERGSHRRAGSNDRPARGASEARDRLHRDGPRRLSDVDLVALLLLSGERSREAWARAHALLARCGGLASLPELPLGELEALSGAGSAASVRLASALELGRRVASVPLVRGEPIGSPADVHRHFAPLLRGQRQESFHALLLDARHRLDSVIEVSIGTLTASLVHPREVFREAVRRAAAAIVLVHHHPSGDPAPSPEDRSVTDRLAAAGVLLGIRVVDHVIVGGDRFFSFRDAGDLSDAPATADRAVLGERAGRGRAGCPAGYRAARGGTLKNGGTSGR
ncbi:MAG: DNA repair protein RadC [Myxococcota bacterium]